MLSVPRNLFSPSHGQNLHAKPLGGVYRLLINVLAFEAGWAVAVLLGNLPALLFVAVYLPIHAWLISTDRREWWVIAGVAVAGIVIDNLLVLAGVLRTDGGQLIPIWLMVLWLLFATTLSHALYWLNARLLLAAVCGAVAGPFSYFIGARLSEVELGLPMWQSLAVLSLVWAMFFPAAMRSIRWLYETH